MRSTVIRFSFVIVSFIAAAFALNSCVSLPPAKTWRPAVRVAGDPETVLPGPYALRVDMEDPSTAGGGDALRQQLADIIEDMLARRGFTRTEDEDGYLFAFSYRADVRRFQELHTEVTNTSSSTTTWEAQERAQKEARERKDTRGRKDTPEPKDSHGRNGQADRDNHPVLVGPPAPADRKKQIDTVIVGQTENVHTTKEVTTSTEKTVHTFVATFDVIDRTGRPLWQADVAWESQSADILSQVFTPMEQMLAALPSRPQPVKVERVREGMEAAFFDRFCKGRRFSTPVFPYEISFGEWDDFAKGLHQPYAMQAYLDLLEYAQAALPLDTDGSLLRSDVGRAMMYEFGGEYRIGDTEEVVPVLVRITDRGHGVYVVTDARIVSRDAFAAHTFERDRRWGKSPKGDDLFE